MRPPSPSIPEREFTLEALKQNLRVDGRALLDMRDIELAFGPELGYVECSLGKTRVIAQVDAKMVKPPSERPLEGIITIHSEISPMASSDYDQLGRASEEEVTITRMLDKVLRRSDAIDKESLCVLAGERVWHVRLTVHFLADAGNMLDCACLAGVIALRHFRRPDVEVVGDEVIVHEPTSRAPVPLTLTHTPFCLTFAYFPTPTSSTAASTPLINLTPSTPCAAILDPTRLEQTLSTGTLSIALNAQREIVVLQKAGGVPLGADEVMRVVGVGVGKVRDLHAFVEKKLAEDWRGRQVEVR